MPLVLAKRPTLQRQTENITIEELKHKLQWTTVIYKIVSPMIEGPAQNMFADAYLNIRRHGTDYQHSAISGSVLTPWNSTNVSAISFLHPHGIVG
jgi:hypothetical protein